MLKTLVQGAVPRNRLLIFHLKATDNPEDWDNDGYLDHADNEDLNVDDFPEDSTQWEDSDGDGYGDPLTTEQACSPSPGFVSNQLDCNDTDSLISPTGQEICDSVDND